jgi:hypothetical protein
MRTELRVENVESLVRLAAANISQIQVQMQANNGELGFCLAVAFRPYKPRKLQNAQRVKKSHA